MHSSLRFFYFRTIIYLFKYIVVQSFRNYLQFNLCPMHITVHTPLVLFSVATFQSKSGESLKLLKIT
nr:MAG TPA: hypothetical protein [Caudoviricetes sp.]